MVDAGNVLKRMPVEISRESEFSKMSEGSDDSIFGPENDIPVSPDERPCRELNSGRKRQKLLKNDVMSAQERLDRLASAMQEEG